ncbi:MAG: hypothetical protein ACJA2W_003451 [Planctomycetota bacterium]|jgi:hypothetical protein
MIGALNARRAECSARCGVAVCGVVVWGVAGWGVAGWGGDPLSTGSDRVLDGLGPESGGGRQ